MPTYEYECTKCGNLFDLFQKITDKPKANCPKCNGKAKRLISAGSGIIFKGTGFYETDYKRKTPSSEKHSEKASSCSTKGCDSCGNK